MTCDCDCHKRAREHVKEIFDGIRAEMDAKPEGTQPDVFIDGRKLGAATRRRHSAEYAKRHRRLKIGRLTITWRRKTP